MVYLSLWWQENFRRAAPDGDGLALLLQADEDADAHLRSVADSPHVGIHVFRCQACEQLRAYHDAD